MNASPESETSGYSSAPGIAQPRLQVALRVLWYLVAIITAATFVLGFPLLYGYAYNPPDAGWSAALAQQGFSPDGYFAYTVVLASVTFLIYVAVALVLFWRRSDDPMALFVSIFLMAFGAVSASPAGNVWVYGNLGPNSIANLFSILFSVLAIFSYPLLVPLLGLFPDGRFVPRWMRYIGALGFVFSVAWGLFPQEFEAPTGLMALIVLLGTVLITFPSLYAQVYRYRRVSTPVQRQQTKWFVLGTALFLAVTLVSVILSALLSFFQQPGPATEMFNTFVGLFSVCIPLSIGVAILRYQLWDIDVVINRALVYGALTAILAGVWAASVVLINQATEEMFGSESATAAAVVSTVLVASIFQPLRDRIEEWINKRFYPDKFDLTEEFYEFEPHMLVMMRSSDLLRVAVQRVTDLVHSEFGAILLDGGDGTYAVAEAYKSEKESILPYTPAKKVRDRLTKGKEVSLSDADPFVMLVPLYVPRLERQQVIGLLGLGPREKGKGFSRDDKKALAKFGAEAGKAIYATRLRSGA